jgi:hypothetical protein
MIRRSGLPVELPVDFSPLLRLKIHTGSDNIGNVYHKISGNE